MKIKPILLLIPFIALLLFACKSEGTETNTDDTPKIVDSTDINKTEDAATMEKPKSETKIIEAKPQYYICYTDDANSGLEISISFDKDGNAINVKYKGQEDSIPLSYIKEDYKEGGAHPTIDTYYSEIFDGKANGEYILTHSGIWDYVVYTRGSDGKTFNFTINHDLTVEGDEYRTSPCF